MPSIKSKTTPKYSWQFDAIGTKWEIVSSLSISHSLKIRITKAIEDFDLTYSRFRSDSLVRKMAETPGEYEMPKSAETILNFYDELWDITEKKVTPMVGDVLVSAGYDEKYSLRPQATISPAFNYKKTVERSGTKVTLTHKAHIDIGAVGKGFLIDEIAQLLKNEGHDSFVVDGSGDMKVVGERVEVVGLENPHNTTEVIGTVNITNRALGASATNRRAWGNWHHIVDPIAGTPVQDIVATWVLADSAMIADGIATALFFISPQKLAERYTYEYLRIRADGSAEYSNYFSKGIFK